MGAKKTTVEKAPEKAPEKEREDRLNNLIAVFVALIAVCTGLCNVKDGNIVQSMQQSQARAIDQWAFFQAKSMKQHIAENNVQMLRVQIDTQTAISPSAKAKIMKMIDEERNSVKKYEQEKEQIKRKAEQSEKDYDSMNLHDDQFDLAEACFGMSLALSGITALVRKKWLMGVALAFAIIGVLFGFAGFAGLGIHSDLMAKILG